MVQVIQFLPSLPILNNTKLRRRIGAVLVAAAAGIILVSLFGAHVFQFKEDATNAAPKIYTDFKTGAKALFGFDVDKARTAFESAHQQVAALNEQEPLSAVSTILSDLFRVSQGAVNISTSLADLQQNGLSLMLGKRGKELMAILHAIQDNLADVHAVSGDLISRAAVSGYDLGPGFSDMGDKLGKADEFLSAFLSWMGSANRQRMLVFFQNPSEMRPTGGFIGSYGIATLFQGNFLDLAVRDIYDPDGQLDVKVVPPKPLQGVTGWWGARDANWFFDFPTSAKKVTQFLEASKLYKEQGVTFSGAVAVNVEVLGDVLDVLGPIDLPEYQLTITKDNFLKELQEEVEAGKDKFQGQPKRILKVLAPAIFEKLGQLSGDQKQLLAQKFAKRIASKDIMVYFKDPVIESYAQSLGVAGEVAALPENFFGDYLAVVNASVAGGKSDAMIEQRMKLVSAVEIDGRIHDQLTITKTHQGANEQEWWYRATNHDYLQVYVPNGSRLLRVKGNTEKALTPLVAYAGRAFSTDKDVTDLEAGSFMGKDIFTAWLDTKAGAHTTIGFDYYGPYRFSFRPGEYQFIFDKQSGYHGGLDLELHAPDGFQWQETSSPVFTASYDDLPARLALQLHLAAVPR